MVLEVKFGAKLLPVYSPLKGVHWCGNCCSYFQNETMQHKLQQSYLDSFSFGPKQPQ